MKSTPLTRRDLLKGAAAITAAASVDLGIATRSRRAEAQQGALQSRPHIENVRPEFDRVIECDLVAGARFNSR